MLSRRFAGADVLDWLRALVIVAAGWYALTPSLGGGWLWDDDMYITQNPLLRTGAGLGRIWFAPPGINYFPVTETVQWCQWHLWGNHASGYRLTNLGLHLLSAFLLWRLLTKLFSEAPVSGPSAVSGRAAAGGAAWIGGLIFAVHPVGVESVAWVSELKNTLSLPFLLLAMGAYLDFDRGRVGPRNTLLALLWFVLAMLCKSTVAMFPVVLLLHAWWRRGRIVRRDWLASTPFFGVSLLLGVVTVWFEWHRAMGPGPMPTPGVPHRLAVAGTATMFYLSKSILPVNLLPIYPRWAVRVATLEPFLPWLAMAAVAAWLWRRRVAWSRHCLFGLGFFLLNLAPVLGLVTLAYQRIAWAADHFAYLSLIGLAGLAAAATQGVARRWSGAVPAAVVVGMLLAGKSHGYAGYFRSEESLWTMTLAHNPGAWPAHNELGVVLMGAGKPQAAVAEFRRAVELYPEYAKSENNLGLALAQAGRPEEAISHYERAYRLQPDLAEVQANLGLAKIDLGRWAEGVACFEKALKLQPDLPVARTGLSRAYLGLSLAADRAGRGAEALEMAEQSVRDGPGLPEPQNNLGNLLSRAGRIAEAIGPYELAAGLEPGNADFRYNLGLALQSAGRKTEAADRYREALRLNPGMAQAENSLGIVEAELDRPLEAIGHFERALRLQPDNTRAHDNLGLVLRRLGRTREAAAEFEAARRLRAAQGSGVPPR